MTESTLGARLIELKERSGLSLANIAKASGYRNASSIQRYFDPEYTADFLPSKLAARLKDGLTGYGDPPITTVDIERLTEYGFMFERGNMGLSPAALRRRPFTVVECSNTHPKGRYIGEAEIFGFADDPVTFLEWPEKLSSRPIYGAYLSTISLAPRHELGELVIFDTARPPVLGADVIAQLSPQSADDEVGAFVGKLVSQTRENYEFATLTPPSRFSVERPRIDFIYPILRMNEVLPETDTHSATKR